MNPEQDFNEDLFEHYRIVVDKGQSLLRIDKFLVKRVENASRTKIQNAARAGNILVNHRTVKPNYKVKPGDVISILLPGEPREIENIPEDIPLNIVYEDEDVLIVNKPSGMVVHPAYGNYTGTLFNALLFLFMGKTNKDGKEIYPWLVHRIDKDTSGLLIIAKNELAQAILAHQFYEHSIKREYTALIWGDLENETGTIEGYINRNPKDRRIMTIYQDPEKGRTSITHYNVIKRWGYVTLINCSLETGRTHQIRAHFASIGHPLFGDTPYGGRQILKGSLYSKYKQFVENSFGLLKGQALHARTIEFVHPSSHQKVYFESELPADFQEVIERWDKYVLGRNLQS
ncbi:MAG TPA: RluA family pseudouridine synthase [Bacteroidales bacterium]|jgi:23S rRNA pseudouridine1911/1915/1917 synthase|nr:RluA family pseudouridine synthase [Bacteroidales bacterium]MDI9573771.1 RluA family pseudouridine synthase [Bacteroidota bacterium]OQC61277.1 MAG: Ribosomal large subunit pseudouridine synthase D [Bacteroidetes bacterium ADurb.Bin012]MBP9588613.1 RluA family pseudouridine synthase [Bacteroidales bacterium]HNQ59334.1 RluA family pseudouridine synthase [Bacteroidales bacterium]